MHAGQWPPRGISPGVGLRPQMPQKCAGTRIEPPPSLPNPAAEQPEAIAALSPPLDPPAVTSRFQGLFVRPYKQIVGLVGHQKVRYVRRAHHDRAGFTQAADQCCILRGHIAFPQLRAALTFQSGNVDRAFNRDRHTREPSHLFSARQLCLKRRRFFPRSFGAKVDDGIEDRVDPCNSVEVRFHQLGRRYLLLTNESSHLTGRTENQIGHGLSN